MVRSSVSLRCRCKISKPTVAVSFSLPRSCSLRSSIYLQWGGGEIQLRKASWWETIALPVMVVIDAPNGSANTIGSTPMGCCVEKCRDFGSSDIRHLFFDCRST